MYQGITIIYLPNLPPFGLFNTRYGVLAIPLIAALIGYLFTKNLKIKMLATIALIVQIFSFSYFMPITLRDPIDGRERYGRYSMTTADFLKQNYNGGNTPTAAGAFDSVIYFSDLPMKEFIYEGTRRYWTESLENPVKYAEWIVMADGESVSLDGVGEKLYGSEIIEKNYQQVFFEKPLMVFKKK